MLDLVDEADKNKDGKIDFEEWEIMGMYHPYTDFSRSHPVSVRQIKKRIPMSEEHLSRVSGPRGHLS